MVSRDIVYKFNGLAVETVQNFPSFLSLSSFAYGSLKNFKTNI